MFDSSHSDFMDKHLKVGEVSKHLHVSPRTVCKWFDNGMLKGYRIPGSDHRRFAPEDVLDFAIKNQLPVPRGLVETASVYDSLFKDESNEHDSFVGSVMRA